MIRTLLAATVLATLAISPAIAQEAPAAASSQKFSVKTTLISAILADPSAKAAFVKVLPEVATSPQLEQGVAFTIEQVAGFVPDAFPADKVKELEAEFAKIK